MQDLARFSCFGKSDNRRCPFVIYSGKIVDSDISDIIEHTSGLEFNYESPL